MMLVLETKGCLLYLFSSAAEAESHLEAIDIENREYEFCDDTGQRFIAELTAPVTAFRAGGFRLRLDGLPDKAVVASILGRARSLERGCDGVKTLDDLRKTNEYQVAGANHRWRCQFRCRGSRRESAVAQLFSLGRNYSQPLVLD